MNPLPSGPEASAQVPCSRWRACLALGLLLLAWHLLLGSGLASGWRSAPAPLGQAMPWTGLAPQPLASDQDRVDFIAERPVAKRPGSNPVDEGPPSAHPEMPFPACHGRPLRRTAPTACAGVHAAAYAARAPPSSFTG